MTGCRICGYLRGHNRSCPDSPDFKKDRAKREPEPRNPPPEPESRRTARLSTGLKRRRRVG